MSNGKVMIVHLIAGLVKKIWCILLKFQGIKMSKYYPKPYKPFGRNINVEVNISISKNWFKNVTHVDTSSFALKKNLANLKAEVDKLDIDKLVSVPVDLSKLSDVVKNDVVEKDVYDKLENIDTSGFVLKTKYDADISELETNFLMWLIL